MNRVLLALAVLVWFVSGAMSLEFPELAPVGPTAEFTTVAQTSSQITLSSFPEWAPTLRALGAAGPSGVSASDYVLSATLQFSQTSPTELGLMVRVDPLANLYWASLNPTNGVLVMDRLYGETQTNESISGHSTIADFVSTKAYKLVYNVKGSSLTAAVFDGTTQVAAVAASDSALAAGNIGVIDVWGSNNGPTFEGSFLNPTVDAVLDGDADLSGKADVADLTKLLNNYNQSGKTWLDGDFTGGASGAPDGTVNVADLTALLNNYNKSVGSVSTASLGVVGTPAPEPGTVGMLAAGALALLGWAGWRRRS